MEDASEPPGVSRYGAAHELAYWFLKAPPGHHRILVRARALLRRAYLSGDEDTRGTVVAGALEHILEQPRWREFFASWRAHPKLRHAYEKAMEWAVAHEQT